LDWIEVSIATVSEGMEMVSGFLYELGITGLLIEDTADIINFLENNDKTWDYVDEELIKKKDSESYVKFYVSNDIQGKEKLALLTNSLEELKSLGKEEQWNLGTLELKLNNVSEADWANNWKKYYKPTKIGENVVIKPTWEEYNAKAGETVVEIDPGMAFGTGTHETTSMCIELLQEYVHDNDTVLDIGCGSGILGIVSAKLGAQRVIGVDFDSVAVEVAKENVSNNGLSDKVEIRCGDLMEVVEEKGRIIVANIIADVIIKLTKTVPNFIEENGVFIASGIIKERLDDVLCAMEKEGFKVEKIVKKGEWAAVAAKLNN